MFGSCTAQESSTRHESLPQGARACVRLVERTGAIAMGCALGGGFDAGRGLPVFRS